MEDATFSYLSNQLKNKATNDVAVTKANAKAKNTEDVLDVANYQDNGTENKINRTISMKQIDDNVKFATINLAFYQPELVTSQIVPNVDKLMQPTFFAQLSIALRNGWKILQYFFIGLLNVWPLLIAIIAGVILYRNKNRWWKYSVK